MGAGDFSYKAFTEPYQDQAEAAALGLFKVLRCWCEFQHSELHQELTRRNRTGGLGVF